MTPQHVTARESKNLQPAVAGEDEEDEEDDGNEEAEEDKEDDEGYSE